MMMFYLGPLPPAVLAAATPGPRRLRCGAWPGAARGFVSPLSAGQALGGAVVAALAGASRLLRSAAAARRARGRRAGGVGGGRCLFQRAGRLRTTTAPWSSRARGAAPAPWNSCRGPVWESLNSAFLTAAWDANGKPFEKEGLPGCCDGSNCSHHSMFLL